MSNFQEFYQDNRRSPESPILNTGGRYEMPTIAEETLSLSKAHSSKGANLITAWQVLADVPRMDAEPKTLLR